MNYDDTNLENFCVEVEINASLCHKKTELKDPDLQLQKIAYGFELPTSMAFLGYDDILVLERAKGTVQRIVNGNIQDEPLLDVPAALERVELVRLLDGPRHEPVVVDGNLITARFPYDLPRMVAALVKQLV